MINNKPLQHGYYTVGEHRGNKRIWLQGGNLLSANFDKGVFYTVSLNIDTRTIVLTKCDKDTAGNRVVSGRKQRNNDHVSPIIDIANADLINVTQNAQKVRVDFYKNEIHISISHTDTKQQERENRLINNLNNGSIKTGVACVGIGVSTAAVHDGLSKSGVISTTEFIVDRERKYLDVATKNNHAISDETLIFEASLEEVEPELIPKVDILGFSLPCTGHSLSGVTKNKIKFAEEHATDATAILGLIRIIDASQPSILYSENVTQARDSATYILLKAMLKACGYSITESSEAELDSSFTHSIENRKRWWFIAVSNGLKDANLLDFPKFDKQHDQLSDILDEVPHTSDSWRDTATKLAKSEKNKLNGKNFGFNIVDESETNIGVCGKGYQKDRNSEPHLQSQFDKNKVRLLTVKELCKAQSVPLHLVDNISPNISYEGLGQGIDYLQGVGVGMVIARDVLAGY